MSRAFDVEFVSGLFSNQPKGKNPVCFFANLFLISHHRSPPLPLFLLLDSTDDGGGGDGGWGGVW